MISFETVSVGEQEFEVEHFAMGDLVQCRLTSADTQLVFMERTPGSSLNIYWPTPLSVSEVVASCLPKKPKAVTITVKEGFSPSQTRISTRNTTTYFDKHNPWWVRLKENGSTDSVIYTGEKGEPGGIDLITPIRQAVYTRNFFDFEAVFSNTADAQIAVLSSYICDRVLPSLIPQA